MFCATIFLHIVLNGNFNDKKTLVWQHRLPGYAIEGLGDFWWFDLYILRAVMF